jgi:hypothetical protein
VTCYVLTGSCPKTDSELRDELADEHEAAGRPLMAEWYRTLARRMRRQGEHEPRAALGPGFVCERGRVYDATAVCPCGHLSERLCDEQLGKGKTCDAPLCRCCATSVGAELDLCRLHAARQGVSA